MFLVCVETCTKTAASITYRWTKECFPPKTGHKDRISTFNTFSIFVSKFLANATRQEKKIQRFKRKK